MLYHQMLRFTCVQLLKKNGHCIKIQLPALTLILLTELKAPEGSLCSRLEEGQSDARCAAGSGNSAQLPACLSGPSHGASQVGTEAETEKDRPRVST